MRKLISFLSILLFVPIRFFLSFRRGKSDLALIISYHKLGDTIFTFQTIHDLRNYYGQDNLLIATLESNVNIFKLEFPEIKYVTAKREDFIGYREIPRLGVIRSIRKTNPRIIVDLTTGSKSAVIALFSGAAKIYGANSIFYRGIYNGYISHTFDCHVREIYPSIIKTIPGMIPTGSGESIFRGTKNKSILIHPTAAWRAKEWGQDNYLELARLLKNDHKVRFIAEKGAINLAMKNELNSSGFEVIDSINLEILVDAIKECGLFIGNDSGPLYLANYLGVPTFTIYGPTNPQYHLPYSGINGFSQKVIKCSPVTGKMCVLDGGRNCNHFSCMKELTVDQVISDLNHFISANKILN